MFGSPITRQSSAVVTGAGSGIGRAFALELARRGGRYAVGSACIGGGQGIAVVLENAS